MLNPFIGGIVTNFEQFYEESKGGTWGERRISLPTDVQIKNLIRQHSKWIWHAKPLRMIAQSFS
jgi:hypothetical protein